MLELVTDLDRSAGQYRAALTRLSKLNRLNRLCPGPENQEGSPCKQWLLWTVPRIADDDNRELVPRPSPYSPDCAPNTLTCGGTHVAAHTDEIRCSGCGPSRHARSRPNRRSNTHG